MKTNLRWRLTEMTHLLRWLYKNQLIAAVLYKKKQSNRHVCVRRLWAVHERQGHYSDLLTEMRLPDHTMHFNYFRMLPSVFDDLLNLVGPSLTKQISRFR